MKDLLSTAIKRKCLECGGSFSSPCPMEDCPLFPFRSGEHSPNLSSKRAIRKYCLFCMNDQPREVLKCEDSECPFYLYRSQRA